MMILQRPDARRSPARGLRGPALARAMSRLGATIVVSGGLLFAPAAVQQQRYEPPQSLSDAEFWEFFSTMSEPGGSFVSENFVSNETSFQDVIPSLQRTLTPGGVYLGVGPEQNFTYIANLEPSMAVIFDIRRQNAMQHLMYKALFELSPTRTEFVARLFSRPAVAKQPASIEVGALFDSAAAAAPNDTAYGNNHEAIVQLLTAKHGFDLSPDDLSSIAHVYGVFFRAGPDVNYGYRGYGSAPFTPYPTYGMLQSATNADSVQMAFLANEENYRLVRDLHLRNLIVPVVGDFAGPTAIRSVGDYLHKRGMTVTAFYVSNVEQYLFRERDAADRFYANVATLPVDSTTAIIRSVPRYGGGGGLVALGNAGGTSRLVYSVSVVDSAGVRVMRLVTDSAGTMVTRTLRDSSGALVPSTADSNKALRFTVSRLPAPLAPPVAAARDSMLRQLLGTGSPRTAMRVGSLTSGIVTVRETLDAVFAGRLKSYQDAVAMTKTTGWK
jgi:hypothetical protein